MSVSDEPPQIVHIIDDDETVRQVAGLWLRQRGLTVHFYLSAEQFLADYQPQGNECLLLDLVMPGMSGLDLQQHLLAARVRMPLIIISAVHETATVVRAMRNGAVDYLQKPLDEQRLLRAVIEALAMDREAKERRSEVARQIAHMSPRERKILGLLAAAKTTPEIASALRIRPDTVERHRKRIFQHLGVDDVPALIRLMVGLRP